MVNLKIELEKYKNWALTQDWSESMKEDQIVIFNDPPTQKEINKLIERFGNLHQSYLDTLNNFGLSEFMFDIFKYRMLSPDEVIDYYDLIDCEMDFHDGLREELLKDGFDFSVYIPVMAGDGIDGCWALLKTGPDSKGEILYWDTDQAGYVQDFNDNLDAFIMECITRVMSDEEPLPLT